MGTIYRNGKANTIIKNGKVYGYASGGGEIPIEIVEKTNTITTISTGGNDASISIDYYEDGILIDSTGTILYSTVNNRTKAINFHLTKIWYDATHTNWRIEALCDCYYNDNIYTEGETIRDWSYAVSVDFDVNNISRRLISPILKGTTIPTSAQGSNGQIYLKYDEYDYDTFMNDKIIVQINKNDNTDKKLFFVGLEKDANDISITDNDLLSYLSDVTNGYKKAGYSYSQNQVRNGNIGFYNLGDGVKLRSWSIDWTTLGSGTYYSLLDLNEPATSASESSGQTNIYVPSYYDSSNIISSAYLKVNNTWQNLIGSDINDVGNATSSHTIYLNKLINNKIWSWWDTNDNPVCSYEATETNDGLYIHGGESLNGWTTYSAIGIDLTYYDIPTNATNLKLHLSSLDLTDYGGIAIISMATKKTGGIKGDTDFFSNSRMYIKTAENGTISETDYIITVDLTNITLNQYLYIGVATGMTESETTGYNNSRNGTESAVVDWIDIE